MPGYDAVAAAGGAPPLSFLSFDEATNETILQTRHTRCQFNGTSGDGANYTLNVMRRQEGAEEVLHLARYDDDDVAITTLHAHYFDGAGLGVARDKPRMTDGCAPHLRCSDSFRASMWQRSSSLGQYLTSVAWSVTSRRRTPAARQVPLLARLQRHPLERAAAVALVDRARRRRARGEDGRRHHGRRRGPGPRRRRRPRRQRLVSALRADALRRDAVVRLLGAPALRVLGHPVVAVLPARAAPCYGAHAREPRRDEERDDAMHHLKLSIVIDVQ